MSAQALHTSLPMQRRKTLFHMIQDLWRRLPRLRRRQFVMLLGLMLIASFAEVCSVAAVLPFLGVLTAPERVFVHPMAQPLIRLLMINNAQQLLLPVALGFCAAALLAGAVRLLLVYMTTRYSFVVGADLSLDVYRRTLYQPYAVHISRNSSELINGILNQTWTIVGGVLVPLLTLFSSVILLTGIFLGLLAIDPVIAIAAVVVFGGIYGTILRLTRSSLQRNSESVARESAQVLKSLQEGLGGIRDVLIDGTQEVYCRIYHQADLTGRLAQAYNSFISASPRYVIETLGMILIAGFSYAVSQREGGMIAAIPVLGTLALGAQRLLPILQQGYSALAIIRGSQASLRDVLKLMDQPLPVKTKGAAAATIAFDHDLNLRNVGFHYSLETPRVLQAVNLKLEKGKRIGFMGATGSGKSTLLDIVMGLLQPTDGVLTIDGIALDASNQRAWQAHIAHVPQSIFLTDSSIEENIAFGVPRNEIDVGRVWEAARQAQLADLIEGWPTKYETLVGERGVRLSGGQRQRIGIARALYKRASVIIFDEATSALDNETERALMKAINSLGPDLTILIIAHRLSTLKDCDLIVEIGDGGIKRVGEYNELVNNKA
jgi:ABC-type multidrug transport system fused ATPase/permease subunit